MLLLLVTLLCLLGVDGQSVVTAPLDTQTVTAGNYKFHKPDNTAACVLPYFVHITISVPAGIGNLTLISIIYGKAFGSLIPIWYNGKLDNGAIGIDNVYRKPSPLPSPFPTSTVHPIADSNNVLFGDMIEISLKSVESQINLIAVSLNNWSPWQVYVPFWIRNMKWWIWDWADGSGGPINSLPVAITSNPPCLFSGAVSADGKTLRLWFVHCVHSVFNGDFATDYYNNNGDQLPTAVPGVFLFDLLTLHIPYPWLAPNPCFPQVIVVMQITFYKWTGLIRQDTTNPASPKYINAYLQIGPVLLDVPFVTTAFEMYTSALVVIAIYPGSNELSIATNTIQNTDLNVITVIFIPGAQLQGGNTVSITLSIGMLTIFSTPWSVTNGIIFADSSKTSFANAYIMVGPKGTCAAYPGSVNCCAQSLGNIMVAWPSYMSYPAWWNSFIIKLAPPGCVLPAGKVIVFVISKIYLGKNPNTVTSIGLNFNHFDINNQYYNYPITAFWQVLVMVATSAEPQGIFPIGFLELWPLAWVPTLPSFEAVGASLVISSWDVVMSGGLGSWVIGTATVLSVRFAINNNVAATQPTALTVTIVLRNGLATVATGNTLYWFAFTSFPLVFRPNIGSVTSPQPMSASSPSACSNNKFVGFTSSLSTFYVTSTDTACQQAWGANAVISFVVGQDVLFVNGAAGTSVYIYMRIIPSMNPGIRYQNGNDPFPDFTFPGGIAKIGGKDLPDTAGVMFVLAYTIVADCRNIPYQPSAVTDLSTATLAARCTLVNALSYISPSPTGFLSCNPGATTATAQNLISFVKYVEAMWTPSMWPWMNDAQRGTWPQQVNLPGTAPLYIYSWGYMFSLPMFAVVVTYPATKTNLNSLGVSPSVSTSYVLAFIVKVDRLTAACSVNTVEENPWAFCVTISSNVVQLLHFPSAPVVITGVPLNQYSPYYGWTKSTVGVCATVRSDGAVAGWYTTATSPLPSDSSDGAWYAFFAFFALPLLCLLCCLAWALWYFRRPKECCPCVPEYPVQEMYWVNAQPACPAPVYMVEPQMAAPVAYPPTTPIYLVQ